MKVSPKVSPSEILIEVSSITNLTNNAIIGIYWWCQERDLNPRPPAYETDDKNTNL